MFPERTDQALISLENRPAVLDSHDRGRTSIGKVDIFRPKADIFVRKLLILGKRLFCVAVTLRSIALLPLELHLLGGGHEGVSPPPHMSRIPTAGGPQRGRCRGG